MRVLKDSELGFVSGGRKTGSEIDRERRCLEAVAKGGFEGAETGFGLGKLRSSFGLIGAGVGALFGGSRTIERDRDCQDAISLGRHRDRIERRRHSEL